MSEKYLSFDLRITKGDQQRYTAVASSTEAQGVGPVTFSMPFTPEDLSRLEAERHGLARDLGIARQAVPASVSDLGRDLFEAIFTGAIRRHWDTCLGKARRRGQILRLRLILLSPDLWRWPWEFLWDRGFLVLRPELSVVRCSPNPHPLHPSPRPWRLRVLVVTAHPSGTQELCVNQELESLNRNLKSLRIFPWVQVRVLRHATLEKVDQELGKPVDVVHFIGHGTYDPHSDFGYLLFETEDGGGRRVSGSELAESIRKLSSPALVVLNACESGRGSTEDAFAGVAQALAADGVAAVLAMQFRVADAAALIFSKAFYHSLFRGNGLDRSVFLARRQLSVSGFKEEVGNPVLYLQDEWKGIPAWPKLAVAVLLGILLGLAWWRVPPHPFVRSDPGCPSVLGMSFARVPAGSVLISDPKDKAKIRVIQIDRPFCISKFEVSQRQWKELGLENNSRHRGRHCPVEGLAWRDAIQLIRRLNERDRSRRYRLPIWPEWMRAAQAGGIPDKAEMSDFGNCLGEDGYQKTAPVGSFKPNALGIYDLFGNVSEWLSDDYIPPGGGPPEEKSRMGGSFRNTPEKCIDTKPSGSPPDRHSEEFGIRIVSDAIE